MSLTGDLVSLVVALAQEAGVMLGVGAVTLTLVAHLLAIHAKRDELTHGYVRAALQARALALIVIILSGIAAIIVHVQTDTSGTLLAPAFVFKWALIGLLTALHFLELRARGYWQDALEGFEGANWYALFIVHTIAPVVSWGFMGAMYIGWLASFGIVWAAFVAFLRYQARPKAPAPAPAAAEKPQEVPVPQTPAPAPVPKLEPRPTQKPEPVIQNKKIEVHANHSLLPVVAELELPEHTQTKPITPAPIAKPTPAPVPTPAAATPRPSPAPAPVQQELKKEVPMPSLEDAGIPGIKVMPKRPEDIDSSNRSPLIKFEADEGPRTPNSEAQ